MELVLVAHGRGAALEVADIRVVVGYDKRALKLTSVAGVYPEVAAQLHRTAHSLGDVHEGAIREHRTIERSIEVVAVRHHRTEVLPHEVGVILYGIAYGTEYYSLLGELLLERGLHRHRVHDGIHCHAAQGQTLLEWYAELVKRLHQLGVYVLLVGTVLGQRVGIVGNGLIVYLRQVDVSPRRLLERLPVAQGLQPELKHPLRLTLLLRDEAHDILVESSLYDVRMHVGGEAVLIFLVGHLAHVCVLYVFIFHFCCMFMRYAALLPRPWQRYRR